jgi:hypothetical protein
VFRLFQVALLIGAGYFVWTLHPLGLGEARAVEHELRDNLTNHAEYFGEPRPTSVSCEKFGTLVNPPVQVDGYSLSGQPVEEKQDPPDNTIFECAVVYDDDTHETWCYSPIKREHGGAGVTAPFSCERLSGRIVRDS